MKKQAMAVLATLILWAIPAFSQGWNIDLLSSSYGTWQIANYVVAQGNYAYVSVDGDVAVIDVSDPADPIEVARWDSGSSVNTICRKINGNYLYVTSESNGWSIIDISNPLNPVLAAEFPSPNNAYFDFVGDLAFVVGSPDLFIYDNSDPLNPIRIGHLNIGTLATEIRVQGDYAFIVGGGLRVFDVTVPSSPIYMSYTNLPGCLALDLAVSGNYAYIACGTYGMYVVDVSIPGNPTIVAHYEPAMSTCNHIFKSGNVVYLMTTQRGVFALNVSQPTNPQLLCQLPATNGELLYGASLDGSHLYGAYWNDGIKIIDVSDPQNLQILDSYDPFWALNDVVYKDGYVFIASETEGLLVWDVSDPQNPVQVSRLSTIGSGYSILLMGDYAYMPQYYGVTRLVDISDPVHPSLVGTFNPQCTFAKKNQSRAYGFALENLKILDLSSPLNPVQLGTYQIPPSAFVGELETDNRFLYAGVTFEYHDYYAVDSLLVLDVNNPANPQRLGMYALGPNYGYSPHFLEKTDDYLYVMGDGQYRVYDISDPTQLVQITEQTLAMAPYSMKVVGNFLYLSESWIPGLGFKIYDVSDPTQPTIAGNYPGSAYLLAAIDVHDNYVYSTTNDYFYIYDCADATHNDVDVTITPLVSPVVIPANGGSFDYYLFAQNIGPDQQETDLWTQIIFPNGVIKGPLLGPLTTSLDSGSTAWYRHQNVPGTAPEGVYSYVVLAGDYPNGVWTSDTLQFVKLAAGDGPSIGDWNCSEGTSIAAVTAPGEFKLIGASPNPFNPTTTLTFTLPQAAKVSLEVFDINGRNVGAHGMRPAGLGTTPPPAIYEAGTHSITFDGSGLPSGIYFARLTAGESTAVQKMVLLK